MMKNSKTIIEYIYSNINIKEGPEVIEKILVEMYFNPGISTKELAREALLPLPIVSAIKKEFIKYRLITHDKAGNFTQLGKNYVENVIGFKGLDVKLYRKFLNDDWSIEEFDAEIENIFKNRPQVDVSIDQCKSTFETSLKRAIFCLQQQLLLGKTITCVGDDDLVSVSLGFLLRKLFPNKKSFNTTIYVIDIDVRIVNYINGISEEFGLPITSIQADLRNSLPKEISNTSDVVFTDPPYTMEGLSLFLTRGLESLKDEGGNSVLLSFGHKVPEETLSMHKLFVELGMVIKGIYPRFNKYEGAAIIGNISQFIHLQPYPLAKSNLNIEPSDLIYTGELRKTKRIFNCLNCQTPLTVGAGEKYSTIEMLKSAGCPTCISNNFIHVKTLSIQ